MTTYSNKRSNSNRKEFNSSDSVITPKKSNKSLKERPAGSKSSARREKYFQDEESVSSDSFKKQDNQTKIKRNSIRTTDKLSDDSWEDINLCTSPASWIYELGIRTFSPCFGMETDDDDYENHPMARKITSQTEYSRKYNSDLNVEDDDDEFIQKRQQRVSKSLDDRVNKDNSSISSITTNESLLLSKKEANNSQKLPVTTKQRIKSYGCDAGNESRIVAPNVSKLSLSSTIDIKLQSHNESITVQCSVDVLKMRSAYFHELITEQERTKPHNSNISNTLRDIIIIEETSPFEAAAFLESLHEGRLLYKGEWNLCWARLSVMWMIEDNIIEFSSQIETHINSVISTIQANNWRTNPNIYAGMKVAVMRKIPTPTPSIIIGLIVEGSQSTGYSKVRVAFDVDKSPVPQMTTINTANNAYSHPIHSPIERNQTIYPKSPLANSATAYVSNNSYPFYSPHAKTSSANYQQVRFHSFHQSQNMPNNNTENETNTTKESQSQIIINDINEPFWILFDNENKLNQSSNISNQWYEPDELFILESKKLISSTDKRIFWEMIRVMIELPQLSNLLSKTAFNIKNLGNFLRRTEYRILWTNDAADYLPKDVTNELINSAYIIPNNDK